MQAHKCASTAPCLRRAVAADDQQNVGSQARNATEYADERNHVAPEDCQVMQRWAMEPEAGAKIRWNVARCVEGISAPEWDDGLKMVWEMTTAHYTRARKAPSPDDEGGAS